MNLSHLQQFCAVLAPRDPIRHRIPHRHRSCCNLDGTDPNDPLGAQDLLRKDVKQECIYGGFFPILFLGEDVKLTL